MHSSNIKTREKYEIEDLPRFFKKRSKDISKVFSNEIIKISTIRSRSTKNDTQEFSFKLELLVQTHLNRQNLHAVIFYKVGELINFFRLSLYKDKALGYVVKIGDKELTISKGFVSKISDIAQKEGNGPIWNILDEIGKYALSRKKYDAQEFDKLLPTEQSEIIGVFLQGITIKLRASIEYINPDNSHRIEIF